MIIKQMNTIRTNLSPFDLYGDNEVALSKAFCYLISKDEIAFNSFINLIDNSINIKLKDAELIIEKHRKEGRTDIEIKSGTFHIIIECKIGKNKLKEQLEQYLKSFESVNKYMCFITQERESNIIKDKNIKYKFLSWFEIIENFENKKYSNNINIQEFIKYANRRYKMKSMNEILIQDLADSIEIDRFLNCNIYRRDITFGTPIYFAPYFTRSSKVEFEGILYISKVLGVLTINPTEIDDFKDDLKNYSDNIDLINKWISGVKLENNNQNVKYTFYFLDEAYKLRTPLEKDKGNEKGTGVGWISKLIPKNRTVSFIDFIKHIPELKNE
jgi:hypothetical protein